MSDKEELTQTIIEYIEDEYLEDDDDIEIEADTPLISSGIVDSFSMVSLKRFLEKKLGIQIPHNRATPEAFDTVEKILELIDELRG
jgi:acyl carrier protein